MKEPPSCGGILVTFVLFPGGWSWCGSLILMQLALLLKVVIIIIIITIILITIIIIITTIIISLELNLRCQPYCNGISFQKGGVQRDG